jgi:hypothetical protein
MDQPATMKRDYPLMSLRYAQARLNPIGFYKNHNGFS